MPNVIEVFISRGGEVIVRYEGGIEAAFFCFTIRNNKPAGGLASVRILSNDTEVFFLCYLIKDKVFKAQMDNDWRQNLAADYWEAAILYIHHENDYMSEHNRQKAEEILTLGADLRQSLKAKSIPIIPNDES